MIERTLQARCDHSSCNNVQVLNPNTTQQYLALMDYGWRIGANGESVYCPDHALDADESRSLFPNLVTDAGGSRPGL